MRALVTGGEGFIGSYLVDHLVSMDISTYSIDNRSANCNSEFYRNDDCIHFDTDITDTNNFRSLLRSLKPDIIFHMAAESRIESANLRPEWCWQTNVLGTLNVMEAAKEVGVKKVIYSSTSAAYGTISDRDFAGSREGDPVNCLNHYAASKVAGENIVKHYSDINTVIFRYFNVYDRHYGRMPNKGTHAPVMAVFWKQADHYKDITVTGDGKQERDFVHVKDVVRANLACIKYNVPPGEIINIGSGESYSINEIAYGCYSGDYYPELKIKHVEGRSGEANITRADIRKAKELLNWTPQEKLEDYVTLNCASREH